ncbi:MAG: serine hydrolase domain-containing protein [Candidatus Heimdallarchaeaceae archaeon]|jgi:CubicO group peptidase (beta-lactamase class C family)
MKIEEMIPDSFTKLTQEFQQLIDDNETGSILCIVYHEEKLVYCNKFGWKDKENNIPIGFDNIFRMYSMTKPITCLAALILYEEGKFNLDDSLEKYLPEFKNLKILKSYNNETDELVLEETKSPITIRQLFTHTSSLLISYMGRNLILQVKIG